MDIHGEVPAGRFFTLDRVILYYFLCFLRRQESWDDWPQQQQRCQVKQQGLFVDKCRGDTHPLIHWRLLLRREEALGTREVYTVCVCVWVSIELVLFEERGQRIGKEQSRENKLEPEV